MAETSITSIITALTPGNSCTFPTSKVRTVRVAASDLGLQLGRKYSTKVERDKGIIKVTRIY